MGKKKKNNLLREVQKIDNAKQAAQQRERERRDDFTRRLAEKSAELRTKVVPRQPGSVQMSSVIEDFMEPFISDEPDYAEIADLLPFAAAAWNIALMPADKHNVTIEQFLSAALPHYDAIEAHDFRVLLQEMVQDKLDYFEGFDREIVDYDMGEHDGEMRITIVSTLPPNDDLADDLPEESDAPDAATASESSDE